jgi:hypothetical protein
MCESETDIDRETETDRKTERARHIMTCRERDYEREIERAEGE